MPSLSLSPPSSRLLALAVLLCTGLSRAPIAAQAAALVDAEGRIDLNRFYTAGETNQILVEYTALYPDLITVEEIGRSYLGAPLMVATVTNLATGPADEKPAL